MATNAKLQIEADISQAQAALKQLIATLGSVELATKSVEKNMGSVKSASDTLASSIKTLAAGFGIKELIRYADGFTTLQNQLKSVTTSNDSFTTALSDVTRIANETGTPLANVSQLYTKLSISAQNLGIGQDRVARATEGISKQMKIFGLDAANAQSVMYQFGQAVGLGVARTEEMKQIMEASPAFMKKMAEAFGKTVPQFMADVAAYKVGSEDLIAAQERMADNPMWGQYQKTVGDSLTTIANNFQILLGRIESATGIFAKLANALDWVGKNIDIVAAAFTSFLVVFSAVKIWEMVAAFRALNATMALNPWVAAATAIAAAATAAYAYFKTTDDTTEAIKKETEAQKSMNEEALKYKGPQLDVGALTTAAEALNKQQAFLQGIAPLNKQRQEQEKAVYDFAKAQNTEYSLLLQKAPGVANMIKQGVAARQNAEISKGLAEDMLSIQKEIEIASAQGVIKQEQLRAIERIRKTYNEGIANSVKDKISSLIKEQILAKESTKLTEETKQAWASLYMWQQAAVDGGIAYVETQLKIVDIENRLGIQLDENSKKRYESVEAAKREAEYWKQIIQSISEYKIPKTGASAAAEASKQLPSLDPMTAAESANTTLFNGLEVLRQNDLISEQAYQTARIAAAVQANDAIQAANSKMFENKKMYELQSNQNSIFGYQTQKQMAKESADFQMKSDMEKTAFAIDQTAQMMTSLGSYNKKAFEAAKAFNIANAVMNTYMGATKAIATYPPPFGFIAAAAVVAMGLAQVASIRSQQYSGRALGGPVMGNQPYVVGENGPEIFTPATSGSITRNQDIGGGGTTNVNFTIMANDTAGFDQLLNDRKGLITQIIRDAQLDRGVKGTV